MAKKKQEEVKEEVKQEVKEEQPKRRTITVIGQTRYEVIEEK